MKIKFLSTVFLFTVLFTSCSKDDDAGTPDTGGETETTILSYANVEFTFDDSARFFATSTGTMYGAFKIDADAAKIIDLAGDSGTDFIAFISPSAEGATIPNGTKTKIQHTGVSMTVAQFDEIKDDSVLKKLTVVDDNDSVAISSHKEKIILFENATGKKGAIKMTAINSERLKVDIKVMK
ncbi:hypothetical protein [Aquimarina sp. I32.4]|uniref:hypothetical protein n=1 Tax=Aquimarina sp. I32.4 TaxID=2053903 RepID=UPI000CDE92EA|nr:hypothetical protein [Aquimarina sp. I32.4]